MSLYAKRLDRGKFVGVGRRGIDLSGADGLYVRGHRLAESATELAAAERGLSEEICGCCNFGESHRA